MIFPGATARQKQWDVKKFGEVAGKLVSYGYKIILAGSAADRKNAQKIRKIEENCVDLTGKTTLTEAAAVIRTAALLVTADSGLMHLAYAVGTATVSLFGPSDQKKWAPIGKNHVVIDKELECSPCAMFGHTPRCRKNASCMSSISASDVMKGIEKILPL